MTLDTNIVRNRVSRMAQRAHCRVSKAKRTDPINRGAYRLTDLVGNRILLGEAFDASLEVIEAYLKRERIVAALPDDGGLNAVRQLAAKRGFTIRRPRARLYVKMPDGYELFRQGERTTPVIVEGRSRSSIEELYLFLRLLPVTTPTASPRAV